MLRLLRFPNLTQPLVTDLAIANIPHLLIQAFQLLSPGVGGRFDRSLLRYQRDFKKCVLVRSARGPFALSSLAVRISVKVPLTCNPDEYSQVAMLLHSIALLMPSRPPT